VWIESKRAESPPFIPNLRKKGFSVDLVSTGASALAHALETSPDLIIFNAASMRTSGKRICRNLCDQTNGIPLIVIANSERQSLEELCGNVILDLPFTPRKLLNRINRFVPGEGDKILKAGPIRLDLERKQLRCEGRETRLTPRLCRVLQILIRHKGEVVERASLFREGWNTDYAGDTRTLDVHISWLRQALELDPRHPRFLKTVRGVGYRLDTEV
jgi:DNA-binding response OmpR family regulator